MYRPTIFDIPRKPQELKSANEGTANAHYRQVSASKDVTGASFYQGVQQFRWETSGNTWFVPSMSYFRLRCCLQQVREDGADPLPILSSADMAPNMGLAANLFKSVELRLNGHTLERISERLPQIDALKTRMKNTGSWLDQVGKTTNFWEPDFAKRREQVACDGYLGMPPLVQPESGPWLTQAQAHFDDNHHILYDCDTHVLTFDNNGLDDIDLQHGSMALRKGDLLRQGALVLQIQDIIDDTHALCICVSSDVAGDVDVNDGGIPVGGVNGWEIQKLQHTGNNQARGQGEFEIIWRPPLGFFDVEHAIPPGGQWMVELNPSNISDCHKNVVESLLEDLHMHHPPNVASQFQFEVDELFFYVYTVESERFDHGDWFLDLEHTRCQLQSMPNNATSLTQKSFDVPGKTCALTLAFQDQGQGSDTRCSRSKFKIRPAPLDDYVNVSTQEGQDLMIERFFLQYGNEQKPVPDFDGKYQKVQANSRIMGSNHLVHRYVDSLMQADLYHTDGGAESFDDWIKRGPYYHFRWPKDAMETSTRVSVNFKFAHAFAEGLQHQVMLFSQWRTAYKITHRDGRVHLPTLQEL